VELGAAVITGTLVCVEAAVGLQAETIIMITRTHMDPLDLINLCSEMYLNNSISFYCTQYLPEI